ncbi:MAG: adenosylhomocysteinase [Candidatus Thermoplasmatota archaeon]|jgi:adenosylhomocysteinase|nr:adenosylhomocysteinase [Candidatus Thermoplasmatota archaeon]MCL5988169.1 adenosylhomocysteinase [Candidatus Thermoplasmatota archaeon]
MKSNGYLRLDWARTHMNVSSSIREKFLEEKPFKGLKVGMALHVEAKTGIFALLLKEGGADVHMASCNPLSTDDSVVKSLKEDYGMDVHAKKGESEKEYYEYLYRVLDSEPDIIVDDGGDLVKILHTERKDLLKNVIGGNEETTTGVNRLKVMERNGDLLFPMFDVNDASMKHLFDNRYGTGQSALDGIMNATNILVAGKNVTVAGFGYCGKGIAMRMKGMGARVIVSEIDPIKANEALMEGYSVMPISQALSISDMAVTATGVKSVIPIESLRNAKDGIILSNAGHFDNEIDKLSMEKESKSVEQVRDFVKRYELKNGKSIYLISDGRLVNLAAGQGHPVEIMDMSFAIQALTAQYLVENHEKLSPKVYSVPENVDRSVAEIRLKSLGLEIDTPTEEQIRYMNSWLEGT